MFSKWSDKEVMKMHTHLMDLWDRIQAGKIDISGFGYEMVEKLLNNIMDEGAKRDEN